MTAGYACRQWHDNLDVEDDGETIDDLFDQRSCRLYQPATAELNRDDGSVDDWQLDDYADIECSEHAATARYWDDGELAEHIDNQTPWYTCLENDGHDDMVFPTEEAYDEHRQEWHGEGEEEEEDEIEIKPKAIHHCPHPHARISPTMRRKLADRIRQLSDERRLTLYTGFLVPTDTAPPGTTGVLNCDRANPDHFATWRTAWPHHVYIDRRDPHITSPSSNSLHDGWA